MCDKVWKDYQKRGVYNHEWMDPTGDKWSEVIGGRGLRRGFAQPAALKGRAEFPSHPPSRDFVVASCFVQSNIFHVSMAL